MNKLLLPLIFLFFGLSYSQIDTAYFGKLTRETQANTTTGNSWNDGVNIVYTCPGTGPVRVVSMGIICSTTTPGNYVRFHLYNSSGKMVAQGSDSAEIPTDAFSWVNQTTFKDSNLTAIDTVLLTGGDNYIIRRSLSGAGTFGRTLVTSGYMKYTLDDLIGGAEGTLPASPLNSTSQWEIRVGVDTNYTPPAWDSLDIDSVRNKETPALNDSGWVGDSMLIYLSQTNPIDSLDSAKINGVNVVLFDSIGDTLGFIMPNLSAGLCTLIICDTVSCDSITFYCNGTETYTLTMSNDGNGTTSPATDTTVVAGTPANIVAAPNGNNTFLRWDIISGNGTWSPDSVTATAEFTPSEEAELKAFFLPKYTLTNSVNISGYGTPSVASALVDSAADTTITFTGTDSTTLDSIQITSGTIDTVMTNDSVIVATVHSDAEITAYYSRFITEGSYTIGIGGDFDSLSEFFTALSGQSLTDTVWGEIVSNLHEYYTSTITVTDNGYPVIIRSTIPQRGLVNGGTVVYHHANAHLINITGGTSTTGKYIFQNLRFKTDATFSGDRAKIIISGMSGFHYVTISDCVFDGDSSRGVGIQVYDGETALMVDNCVFKDFTYSGSYGIWHRAANINSDIKRSTFVNCTNGYIGTATGLGELFDCAAVNCGTAFNTTVNLATFDDCASINDAGDDATGSEEGLQNLATGTYIISVDEFAPRYCWPVFDSLDGYDDSHSGINDVTGTYLGAYQSDSATTADTLKLNGDSITKLGQYDSLGTFLSAYYPTIEFINDTVNNAGVIGTWAGSFWSWFAKDNPDISMINSGMHDRDSAYTTAMYYDRLQQYFYAYKGWHPNTRILWATTTHTAATLDGYEYFNAKIDTFNTIAHQLLDSVYGEGGYYWCDLQAVQYEQGLAWSDDVHPTTAGYVVLSNAYKQAIQQCLVTYGPISSVPAKPVAYGVCKGDTSDFKTGSPTITVSGDTATFSVAQIDVLMGVGAAVYYDDGSPKIGYIKPLGKISTTKWLISDAVGDTLGPCSDVNVDVIKHPFDGLENAVINIAGASYLNSNDRVSANIELHLTCYMEQSTYTKDSRAAGSCADLDTTIGDGSHRLLIYAPWDTATQCNLAMFNGVYDTTKYIMTGNTLVLRKTSGKLVYPEISHVQIYQNNTSTAADRWCVTANASSAVFYDWCKFDKCILITETSTAGSGNFYGAYFGAQGGATWWVTNCKVIALDSLGSNTAPAIQNNAAGFSLYAYHNTIIGDWDAGLVRTSGKVFAENNVSITTGDDYSGSFQETAANYSNDATGDAGFQGGGSFIDTADITSVGFYMPVTNDAVLSLGETQTLTDLLYDIFGGERGGVFYLGAVDTSNSYVFSITLTSDTHAALDTLNNGPWVYGSVCSVSVDLDAGFAASINGGDVLDSDTTLVFTIVSDTTIEAVEQPDTVSITVTVNGIGTIDTLPLGKNGLFEYAEICTLIATYAADSSMEWSGDTTSINGDTAFVEMTADKTVVATFDAIPTPTSATNRSRWIGWRPAWRSWKF